MLNGFDSSYNEKEMYLQQDFFRLWQGKRETGINKRETQWRQWIKVAIEQTRLEMRQQYKQLLKQYNKPRIQ